MSKRDNIIKWSIISIFVGLYAMVSVISTIHVIDFFRLSNPNWLAVTLAIAFEVGAAASLAAIIILDKTSRGLVWALFVTITLMQMMGNMYFAYTHLTDYKSWSELFGLIEEEPIFQKRILALVSGAILPLVALGFIKSLVDYIRPSKVEEIKAIIEEREEIQTEIAKEVIEDFVPSEEATEEQIAEIEEMKQEVLAIENDSTLSEKEKIRKTEEKVARVIAKNPEIKKQIEDKIREFEVEDKYTKTDQSSSEESIVLPSPKVGGL
jgi:hypothetical protein